MAWGRQPDASSGAGVGVCVLRGCFFRGWEFGVCVESHTGLERAALLELRHRRSSLPEVRCDHYLQ